MLSFRSPFDPSSSICKTSGYGYSHGWDSRASGQETMILGCLTSVAVFPSRLSAASHRNNRHRVVSGFCLSSSVFPCQYHSTSAPHSSSSMFCSYQKYKRTKPANFPKINALSEVGERWIEENLHLLLNGLTLYISTALRLKYRFQE